MMDYINGNTPKCHDCKFFKALPKVREYHVDGICENDAHISKHRKEKRNSPYYCVGVAAACFDSEAPDEHEQLNFYE